MKKIVVIAIVFFLASCGVIPVIRQATGCGRTSLEGAQYHTTGSPSGLRSASVRWAANCAGRSAIGLAPKVS